MQNESMSRRRFLQASVVAGAGVFLAACAPKATPVPTQAPAQPATAPTTAPAPAAQKVQIRHMYWGTEQEAALTEQARVFNGQQGEVSVEIQLVPWAQYWDKLWTALAGGGAPDSFWLNMSNFRALSHRGALLEIQSFLDADPALQREWDMNFDSLKEAYRHQGRAFSWPRDYDTIAIALNLNLLQEAGLDYPDEADDFRAWDWATCRSYAEKLTKVEGGRTVQFGISATNTSQQGWFNWIYSNGGTILNEDRTKFTMHEPPSMEALENYVAYRLDGLSPGQEALEAQSWADMFYTGRVGMAIIGNWNIGPFNQRVTDFEYDLVPIPYAPTGKSICMIHGLGDTIDKNTKYPEAAFKWVTFLGSKEGSSILGKTGTVIPSRQDTAELWFDPSFPPKHRRIYLDWTARSAFFPNTAEPATAEWTKVVTDELTLVFEQGKPLRQAMNEAATKVDSILAGKGV